MEKPIWISYKIVALVASLSCFGFAAFSANAYTKPRTLISDARILVACPAQTDVFEGMSPGIDWAGFAERDLLVFNLTERDLHFISVPTKGPITEQEAEQVIRMSDCRAGDKYVLIGKDGGVKRRWSGQVFVDDLFRTIDAMPMRKFEMRTRGAN